MPHPWWKTAVIYQIYPRSFLDTDGDGVGDLPGVTAKLDYVANTLGVDAIWISPFFPSPMVDFGYDVANYTDVDPLFGTLGDFDELMSTAHGLGLKVVIDWVPNHSSTQHPWFVDSRSSRESEKRDWYNWMDPGADGGPPNNWLSIFGGSAWTFDGATGQYYLHTFLSDQPDINWRNPKARSAMLDTLRFWLDRGVDGFRFDACHFSMKDPLFRSNPVLEAPERGHQDLGDYDLQVHLHDRGHPDIHELFREIRALLDAYSVDEERFAVGEIHLPDWDEWAAYYGDNDELHMPYNFGLLGGDWSAQWVRGVVESLESAIPEGAWPNYVIGNHDEARIVSKLGPERARLATLLLLTLRGTPTIYYGDELGLPQADIAPEDQQDPLARRRPLLGRDGCRTPMQWDSSADAGFGSASPWLPTFDDPALNVAGQLFDRASVLSFNRAALQLRRRSPALQIGSYQPIDGLGETVFAYARQSGGENLTVYLNFGRDEVVVPVSGKLLLSTSHQHPGIVEEELSLSGLQGAVVDTSC